MLFVVVAVLSFFSFSRQAQANSAQTSWTTPGATVGGAVVSPTPVAVLHEDLAIRCSRSFQCTFRATYTLQNPLNVPQLVVGSFYGYGSGGNVSVEASFNGTAINGELEQHEAQAIAERYRAVATGTSEQSAAVPLQGFRFRIGPNEKASLVFAGGLQSNVHRIDKTAPGYAYPAIWARHPAVYRPHDGLLHEYAYLLSPIRTWGGRPRIVVHVEYPEELTLDVASDTVDGETEGPRANGMRQTSFRVDAQNASELSFQLGEPRDEPLFGGPVLGIGGRLDTREFILRAGVEFAKPAKYTVYSLNVDTNTKDYLVASAVAEVTSPCLLIIPSIGAGLGVPVRFETNTPARVGVRGQLSLTWPIGIVLPVDYYPSADRRGDHFTVSLLGRISF